MLRQNELLRGRYLDNVVYAMLADEWSASMVRVSAETSAVTDAPPDEIDVERLRQCMESNRLWWNESRPVHARSDYYDIEGFKLGDLTLTPIEREELTDNS